MELRHPLVLFWYPNNFGSGGIHLTSGLLHIMRSLPFCFWALRLISLAVEPSLAVDTGLCAQHQPFFDLTWPDPITCHSPASWVFMTRANSKCSFHSFNCLALVLGCLDNHIWPDPLLYHTLRLASSFPQTASCPCSFVSVLNCASAQIFTTPTPCLAFWCLPKKLAYFWWPSGQNLLVFTFWGLLGE